MNFGDWQAQQKAQKDEERLRKKQAAEALTQYRSEGLSEEDTKLKELREQERQQRTEAKQKLQEFKSTLSEEDAKKAALKEAEIKKKKEEEEQLRKLATPKNDGNNENLFVEGAVKSLADNFVNEDGDDKVPSPSPTSVVINEQVTFVFGLISEGDVNDEEDDVSSLSSLDGYLVAINNLLQENTQSPKAQSVKLGYPKVVKIEIDGKYFQVRYLSQQKKRNCLETH